MEGKEENSFNAETFEEYKNDPRIACRYGAACYQRNSLHINKYKHPPKPNATKGGKGKPAKKFKKDESDNCKEPTRGESEDEDHISDASSGCESPKRKTPSTSREGSKSPKKAREDQPVHSASSQPNTTVDKVNDADSGEPELPPSPSDMKQSIRQKFLVEMPEDFFSFWEFCQSLSKTNPTDVFKDVGLKLVGPYDVLSGKLNASSKKRVQSSYLLHWRYYYDPPEFQTVLKGDDKRLYHLGYFRDDPKSMPVFVASNCAAKDGTFTQVAENIFGAVNVVLSDAKKSGNPFIQSKIPKLQNPLQAWAKENGFTLETKTKDMKQRDRKSVSKTFHGLGLVVPVEKKTELGYRELLETDACLKRMLRRVAESETEEEKAVAMDKLQPVITAANIANDECDFGTSVELGLDFFSFGERALERVALQLLTTGYNLLGRNEFAKIAKAHLSNRKNGSDLNMFP